MVLINGYVLTNKKLIYMWGQKLEFLYWALSPIC